MKKKLSVFILTLVALVFSCRTTGTIEENIFPSNGENYSTSEISGNDSWQDTAPDELEENLPTQDTQDAIDSTADDTTYQEQENKNQEITLLFAGDIMAHTQVWNKGKFQQIWENVQDVIQEADLAFANMETPVNQNHEYANYPQFNVKDSFAQAAIDAGFDVFSLANNHTNDWFLEGIRATRKYFDSQKENGIYSAGIRHHSGDPWTYQLIDKNGWTILFVAVTEITNRPSYRSYIDYVSPGSESRASFRKDMKELREKNPCDLFVLSIHCCEAEYIRTVSSRQRQYYMDLLGDGAVDIVWANHPHVPRKWEIVKNAQTGRDQLIFYSQGNTISGQRKNPNYQNPDGERDWTGDGFLGILKAKKNENGNGMQIVDLEQKIITTYIRTDNFYQTRFLDDDFLNYLEENERTGLKKYMESRKALMEKIQETTTCQ